MGRLINIAGMKIGRLTVIGLSAKKRNSKTLHWDCICECGGVVTVAGNNLRNEHTKSCGCLQKEAASVAGKKKIGKPNHSRRRLSLVVDGVMLYKCGVCNKFKEYDDFPKDKRTLLGITYDCKKCRVIFSLANRDKDKARDYNRINACKLRSENPEKYRERERKRVRVKDDKYHARMLLNRAIKSGKITRPSKCSECDSIGRITAHHDDYSKPLEVVWLCYECHGKKHRKAITFERIEKPEVV